MHEKYAIYADTESNIQLTEEQRRKMNTEQLRKSSLVGVKREDDIHIYTTKHYFYGMLIQKMWKRVKRRALKQTQKRLMKYKSQKFNKSSLLNNFMDEE